MFWRKTREAIGRFHPLHQGLVWERTLSAAMRPADWAQVLSSLAQHDAVVRRRKWRLPEHTQSVLVPLVRVLSEDIAPGGTLGVTADLRGPGVRGKAGPQRDLPVRRPIRRIREWYVFDPWLSVRAELRDRSVLELTVADRIRHRKITKRTPRGKIKTKTKTKTVRRIGAVRTLSKGRAIQQPAVPPPPWVAVKIRNDKRAVIRAAAKVMPHSEPTEQILAVTTELFRWTPARQQGRTT